MALVLPSAIDYKQALPALPDATQSISVAAAPVNGSQFTSGQQVIFDLLNRGFLVPDSMYLSYSYVVDSSGITGWRGTPAYSAFNRLDVQIGSQTSETIQNFGLVCHMLVNTQLDVAQKYGMQNAFLYDPSSVPVVPTLEELDGKILENGTGNLNSGTCAVPLISMLSNAEKLVPLFAMPQVRMVLTLDSLANQFTAISANSSVKSFTIANVELRYKVVDFGGAVENVVLSMGDKLYIKTQSFACSSQTLPATVGYAELIYNQRFASVKSLYAICGGASVNGFYDAYDLTGANAGDYSFSVGGQIYPQKAISTRTNKAGALMELKSAVGSIYDKSNNMSINRIEFNYVLGTATTVTAPAKFIIGTSVEKLNSESLLTGISTQNSPISFRCNIGSQMASASTVSLITNYDALLEIDTMTRQASVKA